MKIEHHLIGLSPVAVDYLRSTGHTPPHVANCNLCWLMHDDRIVYKGQSGKADDKTVIFDTHLWGIRAFSIHAANLIYYGDNKSLLGLIRRIRHPTLPRAEALADIISSNLQFSPTEAFPWDSRGGEFIFEWIAECNPTYSTALDTTGWVTREIIQKGVHLSHIL